MRNTAAAPTTRAVHESPTRPAAELVADAEGAEPLADPEAALALGNGASLCVGKAEMGCPLKVKEDVAAARVGTPETVDRTASGTEATSGRAASRVPWTYAAVSAPDVENETVKGPAGPAGPAAAA